MDLDEISSIFMEEKYKTIYKIIILWTIFAYGLFTYQIWYCFFNGIDKISIRFNEYGEMWVEMIVFPITVIFIIYYSYEIYKKVMN